jgi:hypothetical protein
MNGAAALSCAGPSNAPSTGMMIRIGSRQNPFESAGTTKTPKETT